MILVAFISALFSAVSASLTYYMLDRRRRKPCKHPFDYQLYPDQGLQRFKLCIKCHKAWEWKSNQWKEVV